MGKYKRIPLEAIEAMKQKLDNLEDKRQDKIRTEAADMLRDNIRKALKKGYSINEITRIMADGNVDIPARLISKMLTTAKPKKDRERPQRGRKQTSPAPQPGSAETAQGQTPGYYTPDLPDSEL